MTIWFALLIPLIAGVILYKFFRSEIVWWELTLPIIATTIIILIVRLCYEFGATLDTEYRGYLVTQAKYYEYWSTWVDKTCYNRVCTGSGKDEICTDVPYDCSYCDKNSPYWEAIDTDGNVFRISQPYYFKLIQQWHSNPEFIELNRNIERHWSCGEDGNAYSINWDGKLESSEASVTTNNFVNKIIVAKSAFSYKEISKKEASKLGLYDYPKLHGFYKQDGILGLDKLPINDKEMIHKKFQYINGLGYKHHGKVFVLLFPNKGIDISYQQEAYWVGGKDNQLTVCIGYDPTTYKMNWVRAFTWDKDKRSIVEAREELMEIGSVLQMDNIFNQMYHITNTYHHPRDFKDFDYLVIELPTWIIIIVYLLSAITSFFIGKWVITNEFNENTNQYFI